MAGKGRNLRDARCSFCGKTRDQVEKLVAGPGVFICDQCITLCVEVLDEDSRPQPPSPEGVWVKKTSVRPRRPFIERLRNLLRLRVLRDASPG